MATILKMDHTPSEFSVKPNLFHTIICLLLYALSFQVEANSKTDVVTLYNGDHVTGEVKSLESGILKLSTDSMGTIKIEWQDIARLESDHFYEIRISDGARHLGSVEPTEQAGRVRVLDLNGEYEFDALQVVQIRPIEKSVLDRLEIYFAAGYSYTRASSIAQSSINTKMSYENEKSLNVLTGRASLTDSDEESTSSSRVDLDRAVWTKRNNIFTSSSANYESNDELGLDHRIGVGAGLGTFFVDTYRNRLTGIAGLQVTTEESKNNGTDQNIELYFSGRYRAWRLDTPELDLDFGLNVYPSLTDSGRVRSGSDLRLRWELIEDLFFDITAYGTYDNRADSSSGVDYGVTTGLGWEF
jgi:hypothetical protein